ncbi:hypothetical protein [Glutamicibacter endophyticus]|uniref:hypothetical protein n=1 Tax=Glutamicibacter endophyticus TaxID=1522174 RepID=UPI003AF096D8
MSGVVVRRGQTVREPWTSGSASVQHYLHALHRAGVDVPEPLGQDEAGRQVLEFIHGALAIDSAPLTGSELRRVGALVRQIHDASTPAISRLRLRSGRR